MPQLILQRPPETLHRRLVSAIPLPTHGGGHAELLILIVLRTILGLTVGVVDQAWAWALRHHRIPYGVAHQVRRYSSTHGMSDYFTGVSRVMQISPVWVIENSPPALGCRCRSLQSHQSCFEFLLQPSHLLTLDPLWAVGSPNFAGWPR